MAQAVHIYTCIEILRFDKNFRLYAFLDSFFSKGAFSMIKIIGVPTFSGDFVLALWGFILFLSNYSGITGRKHRYGLQNGGRTHITRNQLQDDGTESPKTENNLCAF